MRFFAVTIISAFLFVFFAVPVKDGNTVFESVKSQAEFQSFLENENTNDKVSSLEKEPLKRLQEKDEQEEALVAPEKQPEDTDGSEVALNTNASTSYLTTNPTDSEPSQESFSKLSPHGILEWTNYYRTESGLEPLSMNQTLGTASNIKVYDMFDRSYFEHVAPDGTDVSDVVDEVGYEFINVGENLALGDFRSSKDLVDAWMDSPGHRENILNEVYEELGVSVHYGNYQGNDVWLSAQTFAKPSSSCASPNKELKERIAAEKVKVENFSDELVELRAELREMEDASPSRYNQKVAEYNDLAQEINALNKELKAFTEKYNTQVDRFNACASS